MTKTILTVGIISVLFATNGYAATQLVAVYSCTNGCNVTNNANRFSCAYPDGKSCGNPTTNIFVPQMSTPVTNVMPVAQEKSTATSARAARVSRPNATTKPIGNKPSSGNVDKSSNGWFAVECPEGCTADCITAGQTVVCDCKDDKGNVCKDEYHTSAPSTNDK